MPVRKLTRSGAGDDSEAEGMISGGIADPLGQEREGAAEDDCGDESMVSGGVADPLGEPEQAGWAVPSRTRLERAAGEIISALHDAKQELAREMEANLKQLKAVLKETQRITKDMEAVLREAKAEPDSEELARGASDRGDKPGKQAKRQQDEDSWDPPTLKGQEDQENEDEEQPGAH